MVRLHVRQEDRGTWTHGWVCECDQGEGWTPPASRNAVLVVCGAQLDEAPSRAVIGG